MHGKRERVMIVYDLENMPAPEGFDVFLVIK